MKKFILFFALFAMCLGAKAQWENIRNAGDIYYTDIHFCNADTGYVVGSETLTTNRGIVEKTTDGGNSWERIYIGYDIRIQSVSFQSPDTGYICGFHHRYNIPQTNDSSYSIILKTIDGGANWTLFMSIQNYYEEFYQIRFLSELNGIISSHEGAYYTTNGGGTWNFLAGTFGHIGVLNENVGMIGKHLFHFDGSELIIDEEFDLDDNTAYGICDINMIDNHTFFYGGDGNVHKYTNGYNEILLTPPSMCYYTGVYFVNPSVGFVGGTGLYRTDDGGRTWGEYFPIDAIKFFFIDENNGFALTEGSIYKTSTGGLVGKNEVVANKREIEIFPNPIANNMTVNLSTFELRNNYHYEIVNAVGSVVIRGNSNSAVFDIDLQGIETGMYFIYFEDLSTATKFIKE